MQSSYPFLLIAKAYRVDYALVLDHADWLRIKYFSHLTLRRRGLLAHPIDTIPQHVRNAIWDAVCVQQDIRDGTRKYPTGERLPTVATPSGVKDYTK